MKIFFCKGKKLTSKIIASVDGGDCSHVALTSPTICDGKIIAHSTHRGVQIDHLKTFEQQYNIKRTYELPIEEEDKWFLKLIEENANKPYDYFALAYLGLYQLGIIKKEENIWQNRNHFICTEFVSLMIFKKVDSISGLIGLENKIIDLKKQLEG
jgi:hypothetical protein